MIVCERHSTEGKLVDIMRVKISRLSLVRRAKRIVAGGWKAWTYCRPVVLCRVAACLGVYQIFIQR